MKQEEEERLHWKTTWYDFLYEGMKEKILDSYYYGNIK